MIRIALAVVVALATAAAAEQPDLRARVDRLIGQLADPWNAARATPGDELARLPPEALPLLEAELPAADRRPWQVRCALDHAIAVIVARRDGKPRDAFAQRAADGYRARLVDSYRAIGARDPRWDAPVEEALTLAALDWADDPLREGDEAQRAIALLDRAIAQGCPDPYVVYVAGDLRQNVAAEDVEAQYALLQRAAAGIRETKYHALDRAFVLWRGAQSVYWSWNGNPHGKQLDQAREWLAALPATLAEAADDPVTLPESFLYLCDCFIDFSSRIDHVDHAGAAAPLLAALRAAKAENALVELARSNMQQSWAWDARGSGFANTVTADGRRLMAERMGLASASLTRADALDPDGYIVPIVWLEHANGLELPRERMDQLLRRSMRAFPGHRNALIALAEWLEPKWFGSREEMLAFGRHCLALGDWDQMTPEMLCDAHGRLSRYAATRYGDDNPDYWRDAEVWADMQAVYDGGLARRPKDHLLRSRYAYWAWKANRFDVARDQLAALGDHAVLAAFGTRAKLDEVRRAVAAATAPP